MSQAEYSAASRLATYRDAGLQALDEIADGDSFGQPRVCFHFQCEADAKAGRWGDEAISVQLARPLLEAMPFELILDCIGGHVGIEAWEFIQPSRDWLKDRLPRMIAVADAAAMDFLGWTFEPKGGPIVSACRKLEVFDAHSQEGSAKLDFLLDELKKKSTK